MKALRLSILLALALTLACEKQPPKTSQTSSSTPEASAKEVNTTPPIAPESNPAPASGEESVDCKALAALDAMDSRKPVPLQPMMAWHQKQNMMEHLVAIQRITGGLAKDDWDEVAKGSALIESSPQMAQMCQHMGSGAAGFTELALDFHKRADKIGEAAKAKDKDAVLAATSNTIQACTGCHAAFKQQVVDAATWQKLTGSEHQPGGHHGGGHHGGHH